MSGLSQVNQVLQSLGSVDASRAKLGDAVVMLKLGQPRVPQDFDQLLRERDLGRQLQDSIELAGIRSEVGLQP